MPRTISSAQYDQIIAVVRQYPEGAAPDDIAQLLLPTPPRRTLSRLLSTLVDEKRITFTGHGPSLRYFVAPGAAEAGGKPNAGGIAAIDRSQVPPDVQKTSPETRPTAGAGVAPAVPVSSSPPHGDGSSAGSVASPRSPASALTAEPGRVTDDMIASCVAPVVMSVLPRVSAKAYLQNQAMLQLQSVQDQRILVICGLSLLDDITESEAKNLGVTAEQYALWRRYYPMTTFSDDEPSVTASP